MHKLQISYVEIFALNRFSVHFNLFNLQIDEDERCFFLSDPNSWEMYG